LTICHVWPGITPMNVWDMTYGDWLIFAAGADAWDTASRKT